MTASESIDIALDAFKYGAKDFVVKGDPTFYIRIKNIVNRISENEAIEDKYINAIKFRIWFYVAIGIDIILLAALILLLISK